MMATHGVAGARMGGVRWILVAAACSLALGACSSSHSKSASPPAPTTSVATSTSVTTAPVTATTSSGAATTTTVELPTTSLPCQPVPIPTTPATGPATQQSALLTKVSTQSDKCVDHVIFDYTGKGTDPPGYTLTYGTPPFAQDGSGAPVPVAGNAFIVVKVQPGYGYDFEIGTATYTGPKSITVTGNHVRQVVETGDFEGILTWVIGLSGKRPFLVQATGTPRRQLVVSVA